MIMHHDSSCARHRHSALVEREEWESATRPWSVDAGGRGAHRNSGIGVQAHCLGRRPRRDARPKVDGTAARMGEI